jgi:hypothetical protein
LYYVRSSMRDEKAGSTAAATTSEAPLDSLLHAAERVFGRPVAAGENFFDLGGNSLTALHLIALVGADGWRLDVEDVFDQPDMAALAETAVPDVVD